MKKIVAVIGSSGAIGNALSNRLLEDDSVETIYKFSRSQKSEDNQKEKNFFIDIEDENSIKKSTENIPEDIKFDMIFVATGILHNDDDIFPEKSIKDINADKLKRVLSINTIGPTLVGKYFIPYLNNKNKSIFAFLSARVGSISENKLGGWYAYRASKSALNQVIKTFSIELKRINPKAIIIGLQPGTVDSELSAPFKRSVSNNKLFTAEYSVSQLLEVIERADESSSGNLISWDGEIISP